MWPLIESKKVYGDYVHGHLGSQNIITCWIYTLSVVVLFGLELPNHVGGTGNLIISFNKAYV